MKTLKKYLSLALVLALVLTCLPMRVWAEEAELPELEASIEKETYPAPSDTTVPGDITGDNQVDDFDVAMLLWHVLFPDMYKVDDNADFNGDGSITDADVAYLLWHTLFPTQYPL